MTVNTVGNGLTTQEILRLLQQTPVDAAGAHDAGAAPEKTDAAGQNLPVGTADPAAAAGGAVASGQDTLDPKTVLALLKLQEGQTMAQADSLLFGDGTGGSTDPLSGGATASSDPLISGSDAGTGDDPLLSALSAGGQTQSMDAMLALLNAMNASAGAGGSASSTNQALLDLLNGGTAATAATEQ